LCDAEESGSVEATARRRGGGGESRSAEGEFPDRAAVP